MNKTETCLLLGWNLCSSDTLCIVQQLEFLINNSDFSSHFLLYSTIVDNLGKFVALSKTVYFSC